MAIKIDNLKNQGKVPQKALRDIINNAPSLTQEQKDLWSRTIKQLPGQQIDSLTQFLNEQPEALNFLTQNIKSKAKALQDRDVNAWEKILEQEKAFLNAVG